MKNLLYGVILAYKSYPGMGTLGHDRTNASVPFGGRFRMVDFILSSMVNAGITDIGVIMKDNYKSLMDHIGSGKDWDLSRRKGGLRLLPPNASEEQQRGRDFRGSMEALWSVYSQLVKVSQDYIVVAPGDVIASIDLRRACAAHVESGRDITAVCVRNARPLSATGVYMAADETGLVTDVVCGPRGRTAPPLRALEVYIISRVKLLELLEYCSGHDCYSLRMHVLQSMRERLSVGVWLHEGYAAAVRSVSEYYSVSMELLDPRARAELFCEARPVRTREHCDTSTYYGDAADVRDSLVADGCMIEGTVERSILFRGVRVARGAVVRDSVVMRGVTVGEGAELRCVITDRDARISPCVTLAGHEAHPMTLTRESQI